MKYVFDCLMTYMDPIIMPNKDKRTNSRLEDVLCHALQFGDVLML